MKKIMAKVLVAMFLCLGIYKPVHAGVIFTGDLVGGSGVFSITADIELTVNQAGIFDLFVFEDWAADLGITGQLYPVPFNAPISILVNGVADTLLFNYFSFGGYQNNQMLFSDAWIRGVGGPNVLAGDTITLLAQDIGLEATNVVSAGTQFEGGVFGAASSGLQLTQVSRVSAIPSVPAPSVIALFGLGILLLRRRLAC